MRSLDTPGGRRRILFVDALDPFTSDLVDLLKQCLQADLTVVHADDQTVNSNFVEICGVFDAVVIGPGSDRPTNPNDIGFISKFWELEEARMLPVLGICLGFQSLCHSHGAEVTKLQHADDGLISKTAHRDTDIFSGIRDFHAKSDHAFHVKLGQPMNENEITDGVHWEPTAACPSLEPLAWNIGDNVNGPVLMAARHTTKPFWGVQFYPESILSRSGKELVKNWWKGAEAWLGQRGPRTPKEDVKGVPTSVGYLNESTPSRVRNGQGGSHLVEELHKVSEPDNAFLRWAKHQAAGISPIDLLEALSHTQEEVVFIDSQNHIAGRYSIIGLATPGKTMRITYETSTRLLKYGFNGGNMSSTQLGSIEEVWQILQGVSGLYSSHSQGDEITPLAIGLDISRLGMDQCIRGHSPTESPFWGGLMGYISYEAGAETAGVDLHGSCAASDVPDINFAFIHRSIIIDHANGEIYTQTLLPGDWSWIFDVGRIIKSMTHPSTSPPETTNGAVYSILPGVQARNGLHEVIAEALVQCPSEMEYRAKVLRCQESLASGDPNRLFLTDESKITIPHPPNGTGVDGWALYKELRHGDPAPPPGAFLRLSGVVVASSGLEHLVSWTRRHRCPASSGGRVAQGGDLLDQGPARGVQALKLLLPPDSMTGSPKKTSCEILRDIEERPRGVYSGVLGYIDIRGAGDFAVVVRAAVRGSEIPNRSPEMGTCGFETWRVGAGAAITVRSRDDERFLEMESATSHVLAAFVHPGKD
ncbi:putative para-aminobenzoate synthase [Rosellinia necatrix]|uniref:aminodeoxychorismate synthase n=1 Tax=Rosellinia necatrix TaxID=77044 RepID=A0A1W2TX43_ROSNE|nr:putative para-aminobenzoate synthase [Rosellinia necatrix]